MFKVYKRKIEIFTRGKGTVDQWQYECSTNASRTCKEAREKFSLQYRIDRNQVKANFAK